LFCPDGDYARFIEQRLSPLKLKQAKLLIKKALSLANTMASPIHSWPTSGIASAVAEPRYVTAIDAGSGQVTVGAKHQLGAQVCWPRMYTDDEGLGSERMSLSKSATGIPPFQRE
jgi:hypothetical protein